MKLFGKKSAAKSERKYFDEYLFEMYKLYDIDYEYINKNISIKIEPCPVGVKCSNFWRIIEFFESVAITEKVFHSYRDEIHVKCTDQEYIITCEEVVTRGIIATLIELARKKQPTNCSWYFYDADACMEHPQFIYSFFLMENNQIVSDKVTISYSWMDKLDPNVLVKYEDIGLWSNGKEDLQAQIQSSYKKFLEETNPGRLLSIRKNLRSQSSVESVLVSINLKLIFIIIGIAVIILKLFRIL